MIRYLTHLFLTPSAYLTDWRGFLSNQSGHAAIGLVLAHALGWWTLAIYAAWEIAQYLWSNRPQIVFGDHTDKATVSDCLYDWEFVATGVFAVMINPAILVLTIAQITAGTLERAGR